MLVISVPILLAAALAGAEAEPPLRTAAEIEAYRRSAEFRSGRKIAFDGEIAVRNAGRSLVLMDDSGRIAIRSRTPLMPAAGTLVSATGETILSPEGYRFVDIDAFARKGFRAPPPPCDVRTGDIASGAFADRLIRLKGLVTDAFTDEIDARWLYFVLRDSSGSVTATIRADCLSPEFRAGLAQAEVEVTGVCNYGQAGRRKYLGTHVSVLSQGDIRILRAAPTDPFDVPAIGPGSVFDSSLFDGMTRRKTTGTVRATWRGRHILLESDAGERMRIEIEPGAALPAVGARIEVVGTPETDFFRINLTHALLRPLAAGPRPLPPAEAATPEKILLDASGRPRVNQDYFGRIIRLEGIVRNLPSPGNDDRRMNLECGRFLVPVDLSACPDFLNASLLGCRIAVSGAVVMEAANWRPGGPFPHLDGFVLVVRGTDDLEILTKPSWWTAGRLLTVIALLLVALVAIAVWCLLLRHLVERRSRQLFRAEIDRVRADLRVGERTRLAVEIHDSIAQNLTGISLQISAARSAHAVDPAASRDHLETAERMLKSCRTDIRRCIWDLKSEAMEDPDFAHAIRRTVATVADDAEIAVRFPVARSRFSDTTAHALLQIVRELSSNAVLHGRARHVYIAGAAEGGVLRVSVRDDGCGFDVARAPGPDKGHFGLDGIRERIRRLGGKLEVSSAAGAGTRVEIVLRLPPRPSTRQHEP